MKCRICKTDIQPFIDFGKMPIANGFLVPEEFESEYFYPLRVCFCQTCGMVQLEQQPDRERMFHKDYAFFSGTSHRMSEHFRDFAQSVMLDYLVFRQPDPFVVEVGSNDGIMLRHFQDVGILHLGIEPCANVALAAKEKGVRTVCKFFDANLAREIVGQDGRADVILGANVMCHIADLHEVIRGFDILLKSNGYIIFEDPYLGDIIENTGYDQIYDEHCYYFSLGSIEYLFDEHGFEVVDVQPQAVHGGSMRYIVARKGVYPKITPHLDLLYRNEEYLGLTDPMMYHWFRKHVELSRHRLVALLRFLRNQHKRVVGYAATSKGTTVLNYCGIIGPELIEYISDTSPNKLGKYTPGSHIPVRSHDDFAAHYPDYAILFGWNHAEEIMEKEKAFPDAGGKWIVYVPEVKVLE